ncbi:trypsin-like serine protease [Ruegeria sp. Ofav3-42]|uniref:trypsin-like serine protease n=1 Tax=Ruegeria sp. Ofav3-42 TaxID=2917759 RepID=UPI001EF6A272|nr:trypsin-like serine protease [Ruegeria sp. Ofav3-42]MCG7521928.1 trypsin-like serine protease [Ruegeria sp. Ofav3-42]
MFYDRLIALRARLAVMFVAMSFAMPVHGETKLLTFEDVKRISPGAKDEFVHALIAAESDFEAAGINTRLKMAHFIAQVMTETGGLDRIDENMNYSYAALMRVFSRKRVPEAKAREIAGKPIAVANWVYGEVNGNLGRHTMDGWNYRGSGYIQLTGRGNFRARGLEINKKLRERGQQEIPDIEDNPQTVREVPVGLIAAIEYWRARRINAAAEDHDRYRVRVLVNGPAAHGYAQSKEWFNRAWRRVFRDKEDLGFEDDTGVSAVLANDEVGLFDEMLEAAGHLSTLQFETDEEEQIAREEAIREFQETWGLEATGELDDATKDALLDPRIWRNGEVSFSDPGFNAPFDPNQTVIIEYGAQPDPDIDSLPSFEGSGVQVDDVRLLQEEQDALETALGMYPIYETGGTDIIPPSDFVPFGVIGQDDRRAVTDTTVDPARAIVKILLRKPGAAEDSGCTGAMIGESYVLTAAHCIHSGSSFGVAMQNLRVIPAMNRGRAPFGRCGVNQAFVLSGWTNTPSLAEARYYDMGVLNLDCNVGKQTGWFGVRPLGDDEVGSATRVQGYPSDLRPKGRQWVSDGTLGILWDAKGFYDNDTYGGTSGAPVTNAKDLNILFGVHTNGLHDVPPWSTHNAFTRITPARLALIRRWIGQ